MAKKKMNIQNFRDIDDYFGVPHVDWDSVTFAVCEGKYTGPNQRGVPHTEEMKKHISMMLTGIKKGPHSEEMKGKISEGVKKSAPLYLIQGNGESHTLTMLQFAELMGAKKATIHQGVWKRGSWKGYTFSRL